MGSTRFGPPISQRSGDGAHRYDPIGGRCGDPLVQTACSPVGSTKIVENQEVSMEPTQEVLKLEIEKGLREKADRGGGCIYFSAHDWGARLGREPAQILRDLAELLDGGHISDATIEICA
jgi:hypothetical protein